MCFIRHMGLQDLTRCWTKSERREDFTLCGIVPTSACRSCGRTETQKIKRGTPTGQSVKEQADQFRQNSTTLFRRTKSQPKPLPTSPPAGQSVKEQVDQFRQNGTTLFRRTMSQRKPLPTSPPAERSHNGSLCLLRRPPPP